MADKVFSGKKKEMAELLANPECRKSITEMCKEVGISRKTFYKWFEDGEYAKYITYLIDKSTDSELAGVWKKVIEKCLAGDTQMIKLYFELKGKCKQQIDFKNKVVFLSGENEIEN